MIHMEYNTTRNELVMKEYGRHIQKMIDHLLTIEDRERRQRNAHAVIELMGFLNPHLKNVEDFRHKLWDHLFLISDFKLDVDSPYPIPTAETLKAKPKPLPYPKRYPKYSHLGVNLETVIKKALSEENPEKRSGFANAIAYYITGTRISVATCLNLIRMAGYIRSTAFLLPLTRVIEMNPDVEMQKAAILSVSKYNDQRAMDILVRAQGKNKSKPVQEAISQAIERIKSNNPYLAMLPQFLLGSKDRELFQVTLKVFKRILSPADAKCFIAYLHHGDPMISEGAFEILCYRGNEAVFFFIAEFFREQSRLLAREMEQRAGAERLLNLIAALHDYLKRHRDFFPQLRPDIAAMASRAGDSDWGKRLADLLADLENENNGRL